MANKTVRIPVDIPVHPYLLDHCFEGKVVLPAVEAMQVLADSVKGFRPDADITGMTDVEFDKFLYIQPGVISITAFVDLEAHTNGNISATLLTKTRSKKSSITRVKEHATICIPRMKPDFTDLPLDLNSLPERICIEISADKIYRDLVAFGPAYHNIQDILRISEDGAIAKIGAPQFGAGSGQAGHLGSPFPLDAAFHAACVWGQRYARTVAFPVGFEKRLIFNRTIPGETYFSRILPVRIKPDLLLFDIWIYNQNGHIFEALAGVRMRDVSAGRIKPPRWLIESDRE